MAIDAADDNLGIAVQITSDRSKKKKDDTIAKLESHQLKALLHKGLKDKAPQEDPNLSYNSGLRSA